MTARALILLVLLLLAGAPLRAQAKPDRHLTPGGFWESDTAVVCHRTTAAARAPVTAAMKRRVLQAYGDWPPQQKYEIDHLVPLELGGASKPWNLWPQPWDEARRKDLLENRLHRLVCAGRVSLDLAQQAIAGNWVAAERWAGQLGGR